MADRVLVDDRVCLEIKFEDGREAFIDVDLITGGVSVQGLRHIEDVSTWRETIKRDALPTEVW